MKKAEHFEQYSMKYVNLQTYLNRMKPEQNEHQKTTTRPRIVRLLKDEEKNK